MLIGFSTGTAVGIISTNLSDIGLAFLLGAASAFGAAVIKYITNKIRKHNNEESFRKWVKDELRQGFKDFEDFELEVKDKKDALHNKEREKQNKGRHHPKLL